MKAKNGFIERFCVVCGNKIMVNLHRDYSYKNGHYFGVMNIPVGDGRYKEISKATKTSPGVVEWTGKEKRIEYWECEKCFNEAEKSEASRTPSS